MTFLGFYCMLSRFQLDVEPFFGRFQWFPLVFIGFWAVFRWISLVFIGFWTVFRWISLVFIGCSAVSTVFQWFSLVFFEFLGRLQAFFTDVLVSLLDFEPFSAVFQWFSLVFIRFWSAFSRFWMIFRRFYWILRRFHPFFNDFHWFLFVFIGLYEPFFDDFHWFLLILTRFQWFSLVFIRVEAVFSPRLSRPRGTLGIPRFTGFFVLFPRFSRRLLPQNSKPRGTPRALWFSKFSFVVPRFSSPRGAPSVLGFFPGLPGLVVVPPFPDFFSRTSILRAYLVFPRCSRPRFPPKLPELSKYSRPKDAPPGVRDFSQDFQGWPLRSWTFRFSLVVPRFSKPRAAPPEFPDFPGLPGLGIFPGRYLGFPGLGALPECLHSPGLFNQSQEFLQVLEQYSGFSQGFPPNFPNFPSIPDLRMHPQGSAIFPRISRGGPYVPGLSGFP